LYDFIINPPSTIWFGQPWDSFLPPFAGSLLGVLLGIIANFVVIRIKNHKEKIITISILGKELTDTIQILDNNTDGTHWGSVPHEQRASQLPMDGWISSLNTGALRLLTLAEVDSLNKIYYKIKKYNDRMAEYEYYFRTKRNVNDEQRTSAWLIQESSRLKSELEALTTQNWMNP
jgi:hypothetical protein